MCAYRLAYVTWAIYCVQIRDQTDQICKTLRLPHLLRTQEVESYIPASCKLSHRWAKWTKTGFIISFLFIIIIFTSVLSSAMGGQKKRLHLEDFSVVVLVLRKEKKRKKKALCFAVLQPKKREESGVVPFPASYVCPVPYILHACTMHFMRHIKARRELSPSFVQAVSFWGRDNRALFHFAACSWMLFHQLRKEALFEKILSLTQLSLGNCSERNTIFGRISV